MRHTWLLLTLVAAGCASVGPDFERPDVPVNPQWLDAELASFDTGPAELAEWWSLLGDPVLDELIATARRENNTIKIAGLRVIEAQANLNIAIGNQYPQQQVLAGSAQRVGVSENDANTNTTDTTYTQYDLGARLSWEIDFWGRFRRGVEAADAAMLASIASYDEVMLLVTAQVANIYSLIRATEEQLALAINSRDIQKRSYDIVDLLYREGSSSQLDALQAKTLLLGTEAVIPGLEANLRQLKNAMSVLLGTVPHDIDNILKKSTGPPKIPERVIVGVPANLLRQRPDVRRAELQALAQNALVGVAESGLYPSFSLTGSIGVSSSDGTSTTSSGDDGVEQLFSTDSLAYSVGPQFVWPFLNYGRIRNNVRVQDARLQQALISYRETVIQSVRDAEDAMAAFAAAQRTDKLLREGVDTAKRSVDLSMLRYQEGFADYQRVLDAQQALFTQQQRYATNLGEVLLSFVSIYRSLGGGWQSAVNAGFVDDETREEMTERTNWGEILDNPPTTR